MYPSSYLKHRLVSADIVKGIVNGYYCIFYDLMENILLLCFHTPCSTPSTPLKLLEKIEVQMELSGCCNNGGVDDYSQQMRQNLEQLRFRQKSNYFPYSNDLKMNGTYSVLLFSYYFHILTHYIN